MDDPRSRADILVFCFGNPSRGDDALGPAMYQHLSTKKEATKQLDHVELLIDFQLQIEHSIDLENRRCIIFVDASLSASAPFQYRPVYAIQDDSYTTHAMSPAALLSVYQQVNQLEPPPAYLLEIRGYRFDLGHDISEQAASNLDQSFEFLLQQLTTLEADSP